MDNLFEVLSVSEVNARLKALLEGQFPFVSVRGEVSGLRRPSSGHFYFTLKDERSQLPAVLFRGNTLQVDCLPAEGMDVVCTGTLTVFEAQGKMQLLVREVQDAGAGRLQRAFEALKAKLLEEGLFGAERKRRLPVFPRTVGFVTSPTGAALRDFIEILRRRGFGGMVRLFPSLVQGAAAAPQLVEALKRAEENGELDLLVIGRGGGSLEDLWPFNEEAVVRAVAACTVPTISAVGHQIDFVLTDFAADVRAETPSAAAELITSSWQEVRQRFGVAADGLLDRTEAVLQGLGQRVDLVEARLKGLGPEAQLGRMRGHLDRSAYALERHFREHLKRFSRRFEEVSRRLDRHFPEARLQRFQDRLAALEGRLRQSSVEATLKRGFVLVRDSEGNPLMDQVGLEKGDPIDLQFRDGKRKAEIVD